MEKYKLTVEEVVGEAESLINSGKINSVGIVLNGKSDHLELTTAFGKRGIPYNIANKSEKHGYWINLKQIDLI